MNGNQHSAEETPANNGGRHRFGKSTRAGRRLKPLLLLGLALVAIGTVGVVVALPDADVSLASVSQAGPSKSVTTAAVGVPTGSTSAVPTTDVASSSGCPVAGGEFTITAAPDIAGAVRQLLNSAPEVASCQVAVTAQDPADFLTTWQAGSAHPDVWIPDSSVWLDRARQAGVQIPADTPSVATSPVVLALSTTTAQAVGGAQPLTLYSLLGTRLSAAPIALGLPSPDRSMAAVGAILEAQSATANHADARAAFTWALRSGPADLPTDSSQLLSRITDGAALAVPVSEQAVWAHNSTPGTPPLSAVYSASAGTALDFPLAELTTDPARLSVADRIEAAISGPAGQDYLQDNGFRDQAARPGAILAATPGLSPVGQQGAAVPSSEAVEQAVHSLQVSNEPSRLLAVLDVSGSMAQTVPGSGGATRLDLTRQAAIRGLALYPPDSAIGLWVFSRNLDGNNDYRELVPVAPLAQVTDGKTGRQLISDALSAIAVNPDGGTGLYDTTLAAVRQLRAQWDPNKVNTVLLLSDGQNDDLGSIDLADLIQTLKTENDPARPVPVVAVAFGPDSDVDAMRQISQATNGATYVAKDPREIGEIFLDTVGQRLCRPNC